MELRLKRGTAVWISFASLLAVPSAFACQKFERTYETTLLSEPGTTRPENYYMIFPDAGVPIRGVLYFLHGAANNRHMIDSVGGCEALDEVARAKGEGFLIVALDGEDNYWKNAAEGPERYQDMILEVKARVEREFPNLPRDQAHSAIGGISMGAHGAFEAKIRNRKVFGALVAHSPVMRDEKQAFARYPKQFGQGADYISRTPLTMIEVLGMPIEGPIFMDMGGSDPWIKNTTRLQSLCQSLFVEGRYLVGDDPLGKHDGDYWKPRVLESFHWVVGCFSAVTVSGFAGFPAGLASFVFDVSEGSRKKTGLRENVRPIRITGVGCFGRVGCSFARSSCA